MSKKPPEFELRLARDEADIRAGQRLRYEVFIEELGGDGPLVDHANRLECDEFDPYFDHLVLFDHAQPGSPAVGVYRMMRDDQMAVPGRYYSESEYDLTLLRSSGRKLLELGRSCVHKDYRGGQALKRLWAGLLSYVEAHGIEVMFGVASFHGTDIEEIKRPLSLLYHEYLAPEELRVSARPEHFQEMNLMPAEEIDPAVVIREVPTLIKAYLRTGSYVGNGAYIDRAFNTTDVCVVIDMDRVPERVRAMYARVGQKT